MKNLAMKLAPVVIETALVLLIVKGIPKLKK